VGDIISLRKFKEHDPILRKGDMVRLVDMKDFSLEAFESGEIDELERDFTATLEGCCGVVTEVCLVLPQSHETAPGQAVYVDVAVPLEEGWEVVNAISVLHLRRVLGHEAAKLKGYANL